MRQNFITKGIVNEWNSLVAELVEAPSLSSFKACLDTCQYCTVSDFNLELLIWLGTHQHRRLLLNL